MRDAPQNKKLWHDITHAISYLKTLEQLNRRGLASKSPDNMAQVMQEFSDIIVCAVLDIEERLKNLYGFQSREVDRLPVAQKDTMSNEEIVKWQINNWPD